MSDIMIGLLVWYAFCTGVVFLAIVYAGALAFVADILWRRWQPAYRREFLAAWIAKRRAVIEDRRSDG